MDASHLMRRQKSNLPLPFSIIATDIGAGHTHEKENEKTRTQESGASVWVLAEEPHPSAKGARRRPRWKILIMTPMMTDCKYSV